MDFTVASFDFGFHQSMMTGQRKTHFTNFERLCAKIVQEADADIMFGCEVGDFRKGPSKTAICVGDIVKKPFGDSVCFVDVDNYFGMWGFGGACQPTEGSLHAEAETF